MRNRVVVCMLLLFAFEVAHGDSENSGLTGIALLKSCSNAVKVFDGDKSDPVLLNAPYCVGFVKGFVDGANAMLAFNIPLLHKGLKRVTCTEEADVTLEQLVRVLEKYLRSNPQNLHQKSGVLAMVAFAQAFPCNDKIE